MSFCSPLLKISHRKYKDLLPCTCMYREFSSFSNNAVYTRCYMNLYIYTKDVRVKSAVSSVRFIYNYVRAISLIQIYIVMVQYDIKNKSVTWQFTPQLSYFHYLLPFHYSVFLAAWFHSVCYFHFIIKIYLINGVKKYDWLQIKSCVDQYLGIGCQIALHNLVINVIRFCGVMWVNL